MSYRRRTLKLDNASSDNTELVPRHQQIREVFITKMPTGVTIQLVFGDQGDPVDIDAPIAFQPTGDEANSGLYWRNPVALPGTTVDIYIASGGDSLGERRDSR